MAERDKVVAFLNRIGIVTREGTYDHETFLEAVSIKGGNITYRPEASSSAILHEAGHVAITASRFRPFLVSDPDEDLREHYDAWHDAHANDLQVMQADPTYWAIVQASECEANAWSYAAALEIGIDTMVPFEEGFDGKGRDLHAMIATKGYFGINGLFHSGMCREKVGQVPPTNTFPRMVRWLQD